MTESRLSLQELLEGLTALPDGDWPEVSGLSLDSRTLRPGDAFVALRGARSHGLDHALQARDRGAVVVLHDDTASLPDGLDLPAVALPDLAAALPKLASRCWGVDVGALDLVAVTGTNGKSSVAWLLAQALDGAMIGTLGWGRPGQQQPSTHTTPDLFSLYRRLAELRRRGVDTVVLEASSHALDQGRLNGLVFTSTVFTTLGHDHLDYHADQAAYAAAKARLFTDFESRRKLINLDDGFGAGLAAQLAGTPGLVGYSLEGHPDALATAELLSSDRNGLAATFQVEGNRFTARSRLLGRVNLWNLLIVAAELAARGLDDRAIVERLERLAPVPGRMEPVRATAAPLAIVDYAHTPDALDNALKSARELCEGLLWCVFGCGGDRDRDKRPRMGRIAERLADRIVLTDDNPRHEDGLAIIRAIQAGMQHPQRSLVIRERARAIAHALGEAGESDVVLVAGKGHEAEQIVGDRRLPCDDRQNVRQALGVAA